MKHNKNNMKDLILHGEAMIFPSEIPSTAKKIKPSNGLFHIIADSETTGNHHVIDAIDGVEFFQDVDGKTYMRNSKPTKVRCVMTERHSPIDIEPGTFEFGIQKEYDHFAQNLVNVRD
jgi:hypothetical protein